MAWCLASAKPLSKPMLDYRQLESKEQTSVKSFSEIHTFSFMKMHLKISSWKCWPFGLSPNVLFWFQQLRANTCKECCKHIQHLNFAIAVSLNVLAPNRWKAITWTNVDKNIWSHMTSLHHNVAWQATADSSIYKLGVCSNSSVDYKIRHIFFND